MRQRVVWAVRIWRLKLGRRKEPLTLREAEALALAQLRKANGR